MCLFAFCCVANPADAGADADADAYDVVAILLFSFIALSGWLSSSIF